MNIKYLFFLILLSTNSSIFAQNIDEGKLRYRAAEMVAQMKDYISVMSDKSRSFESRLLRKEKALNLFIGKGYEYIENGVEKEGVQMQIKSKNRAKVDQPLIRNYFDNLVRKELNKLYDDVHIEATEVAMVKVSELRKIDDNLWECTFEYDQAFVGFRDGRPVFRKINTKKVKCYVKPIETEDGIIEHIIQLGDVYALETR